MIEPAPLRRRLPVVGVLLASLVVGAPATAASSSASPRRALEPLRQAAALPRIEPRFEPNVGQAARRVAFVARAGDSTVFLTRRGATFARPEGWVRIGFAGALGAVPVAAGRRAGVSNYLLGEDPERWAAGVRASTGVAYPEVWPGVRMTFRRAEDGIEYRFRVAPGADPAAIGLRFGEAAVRVEPRGDLVATAPGGAELRQSAPILFQLVEGRRVPVPGRFLLRPGGEVGIAVGDHDPGRPLVIDPSVRMSTFFGGSGDDAAWAVDLGSNSTFLAGETASLDLPTTSGTLDPTLGGSCDAFLARINVHKLDPVVNATYLGGGGCDRALGLDVGTNGAATLVGVTDSQDLPTSPWAVRASPGGGAHDAWAAQLSPNGSSLVYATYLGGAGDDAAEDVAVDAGVAYVTGSTTSAAFPSTVGPGPAGGSDAFVTAIDATGTALVYSRLTGGAEDDGGSGIAVTAGGTVAVTGWTDAPGFPATGGVLQPAKAAGRDAFVAQVTPSGGLSYATFLGGSGDDAGASVAVRGGVTLVGGSTSSANFPTTGGAYRTAAPGGPWDGFVTSIAPGGTSAIWSTYLGGTGDDRVEGIASDKKGNGYVVGATTSPDLPLSPGRFQDALAGGIDAFLVMLRPTGAAATISTYLGGSSADLAHDVAVESMGEPVLVGETASATFPTAQRPAQASKSGASDAFAASITTAKPVRVILGEGGFSPASVTGTLDTTVQWDLPVTNTSSYPVVDASGTDLFASGAPRPPGSAYSFRFLAAGVYPVEDGAAGHAASVSIPVVAKPRTGSAATTFTVTWCAGQVPAWFVFDVQVQRPGSSAWGDLVPAGTTSVSRRFVPDAGAGVYRFRSRVRSTPTGHATGWSPAASITVS